MFRSLEHAGEGRPLLTRDQTCTAATLVHLKMSSVSHCADLCALCSVCDWVKSTERISCRHRRPHRSQLIVLVLQIARFLARLARVHLQLAMHGDAHGCRTEASAYTTEPELHGTKKARGTTSKKRRPDNDACQKAVLFNT